MKTNISRENFHVNSTWGGIAFVENLSYWSKHTIQQSKNAGIFKSNIIYKVIMNVKK